MLPKYPNTPGVQINEVRLSSPPIAGVSTSIAGFVGKAPAATAAAPATFTQFLNTPNLVTSADQFINDYIGDPNAANPFTDRSTPLTRAVLGFFENGGSACYVVNVGSGAAIGDAEVVDGLDLLEPIDEISILATPGFNSNTVYTALKDQAENLGDRFAILDPPALNANPASLTRPLDTRYAAIYYPSVLVGAVLANDPAPDSAAPDYVTPVGHVAGVYARVDAGRGVHKAPANESLRGVLGVEQMLTDAHQNQMNPNGVNALRSVAGNVVIWGARTVSTEVDWRYINVRRLVNYIEESLQEGLRWAVFEPNNLTLRKQITRSVNGFLDGVWRDGALFGATAQGAYYVRFPELFNRDEDRAQGKLTIEIGLRVTYPAEFIIIRIGLLMQDASTA